MGTLLASNIADGAKKFERGGPHAGRRSVSRPPYKVVRRPGKGHRCV